MNAADYTPVARIASDVDRIPPITEGQRRAWTREVEARFDGHVRDELVAMVLGGAA